MWLCRIAFRVPSRFATFALFSPGPMLRLYPCWMQVPMARARWASCQYRLRRRRLLLRRRGRAGRHDMMRYAPSVDSLASGDDDEVFRLVILTVDVDVGGLRRWPFVWD